MTFGRILADLPRRVRDSFKDPLRRRNLIARVIEGWVGGVSVALWVDLSWWAPLYGLTAPLAEFLLYEFLLEPAGLAGHYWERGPRVGEVFTFPHDEGPSRPATVDEIDAMVTILRGEVSDRDREIRAMVNRLYIDLVTSPTDEHRQIHARLEDLRRLLVTHDQAMQQSSESMTAHVTASSERLRGVEDRLDMLRRASGEGDALLQTVRTRLEALMRDVALIRPEIHQDLEGLRQGSEQVRAAAQDVHSAFLQTHADFERLRGVLTPQLEQVRAIVSGIATTLSERKG